MAIVGNEKINESYKGILRIAPSSSGGSFVDETIDDTYRSVVDNTYSGFTNGPLDGLQLSSKGVKIKGEGIIEGSFNVLTNSTNSTLSVENGNFTVSSGSSTLSVQNNKITIESPDISFNPLSSGVVDFGNKEFRFSNIILSESKFAVPSANIAVTIGENSFEILKNQEKGSFDCLSESTFYNKVTFKGSTEFGGNIAGNSAKFVNFETSGKGVFKNSKNTFENSENTFQGGSVLFKGSSVDFQVESVKFGVNSLKIGSSSKISPETVLGCQDGSGEIRPIPIRNLNIPSVQGFLKSEKFSYSSLPASGITGSVLGEIKSIEVWAVSGTQTDRITDTLNISYSLSTDSITKGTRSSFKISGRTGLQNIVVFVIY